MKKFLSLTLALLLVLGTMTTSFAANLDLINLVDPEKSFTWNQFVGTPSNTVYVGSNMGDYAIEWNGELYSANELNALTSGEGALTFAEAIELLEPIVIEPPVVYEEKTEFWTWNYVDSDSQLNIIVREFYEDGTWADMEYPVVDRVSDFGPGFNWSLVDVTGERDSAFDLIRGDNVALDFAAGNVDKITVEEVENLDHLWVGSALEGEVVTCEAVEGVWFAKTTNVAIDVNGEDRDFGTEIDYLSVAVNGEVTTAAGYTYGGYSFDGMWFDFEGLFTTEGEFEIVASATNDADSPVTITDDPMTLIIDMTAPVVEIEFPTTATAFEVGVDGDKFVVTGTVDEEYLSNMPIILNAPDDSDAWWSTEAIVEEDGTWSAEFDLSGVDFAGSTTMAAMVYANPMDCARNESWDTVEFILQDTTAPKVVEIAAAGEDWVHVVIDENFKIVETVSPSAFTVTVNNVDYVATSYVFDEDGNIYLWIDEAVIEAGYVMTVRYSGDSLMDTAGNKALPKVTPIFNNGLSELPEGIVRPE